MDIVRETSIRSVDKYKRYTNAVQFAKGAATAGVIIGGGVLAAPASLPVAGIWIWLYGGALGSASFFGGALPHWSGIA